MRTRLLSIACLTAAAACSQGSHQPCSAADGGCLNVAGSYTFRLGTNLNCSVWQKSAPTTSVMSIAQGSGDPSQLTVTLWPTENYHTLSGTLYADDTIYVAESQQSVLLGSPWATITGGFTANPASAGGGLYFAGQFLLQGGSSTPAGGGQAPGGGAIAGQTGGGPSGGLGCAGATTIAAVQASGSPDAGAGGGAPDAGLADGGL